MAASHTRIHLFLVMSYVSCLSSHAAVLSFNYSGPDYLALISSHDTCPAVNTTVAISNTHAFCYCVAWPSSADSDNATSSSSLPLPLNPSWNCTIDFPVPIDCSIGSLGGLKSGFLPHPYTGPDSYGLCDQPRTTSWMEQASVAGSVFVGLVCAVAAGLVLCSIRIKRPQQSSAAIELEDCDHIIREAQLWRGSGPKEFLHSQLAAATCNFAEERKIGRGGFGPVYRGYLSDQDCHVAIKALSQEQSVQGLQEFQAEVTVMSQLRHRNIVQLIGWCGRRGGLALVYELLPGGSLDKHLDNSDTPLTWSQRHKIVLGLGSALRYLHTDCNQCVVHGDIKPANVMLDSSLHAKLGDFGLARLVDHGAEPQTTQVVAGTVGYIDPEFVNSRRRGTESDMYSFGVVLLEIACGRGPRPRPSDQAYSALLAWVRDMYHENRILDAADPRLDLDDEFDKLQMERLLVTGLWCAHHDPMQRPSVTQAMDVLLSESANLPVLGPMSGSGDIRSMQRQAFYGDASPENTAYLHESAETAYLTTTEEDSAYFFSSEEH